MSAGKHDWAERKACTQKNKGIGEEERKITGGKAKRTNKYR
jgi:hypothetical protein